MSALLSCGPLPKGRIDTVTLVTRFSTHKVCGNTDVQTMANLDSNEQNILKTRVVLTNICVALNNLNS